jgi:hypothetical protein
MTIARPFQRDGADDSVVTSIAVTGGRACGHCSQPDR